jgi:DNA-binding NtrC family response regulator
MVRPRPVPEATWSFLRGAAALSRLNPFTPERRRAECALVGEASTDDETWSLRGDPRASEPRLVALGARLDAALDGLPSRLLGLDADEAVTLEEAILFAVFQRRAGALVALVDADDGEAPVEVPWYPDLAAELGRWASRFERPRLLALPPEHLLAIGFQLRRAFVHVFESIVGNSRPAAALRASSWASIVSCDVRRYLETTYGSLKDFSVLITGPSGSGKELVARAIGRAQYRAFSPSTRTFAPSPFRALNPAALAPTLVESELFGHAKGSFTGAVKDAEGWLETDGTVFLDEIGELDVMLQVKLLRVLQTRTFERIGERTPRRFDGKLIAATHRDLAAAIEAGRFRADLYYRLCADRVETPSLAAQLADRPSELGVLVDFIVGRLVGGGDARAELAGEITRWIEANLGLAYPWPGNVRELEQCVRNVMLKGRYVPLVRASVSSAVDQAVPKPLDAAPVLETPPRPLHPVAASLDAVLGDGPVPIDRVLEHYVSWVVATTGSYVAAGRALEVDRRTIAARARAELVDAYTR